MPPAPRLAARSAALLLWALAACSAGAPSASPAPPTPAPAPAPTAAASSTASGGSGLPGCKLPAPLKSDDACSADADCGVSDPCHAKACVARARSHPPTPDTMCTQILDCRSADANRCGCFEGRCALIPPS
jgi:hypothetical protein